jgi:hypothetical protein
MLGRRAFKILFLLLPGFFIAGFYACGGGGGGGESTVLNRTAPSISSHPQDTAVVIGQTATFRVEANGTAPITYQWKKNGADIGGNSDTYTTPATTMGDDGAKFSVVVTNVAGSAVSREAILTVTAMPVAPIITSQPQDISVSEGQTATFSVRATGTAPLNYQWKKNGLDVGGNSDTYTTPATMMADDGAKFRVVVTNVAGSEISRDALLTVSAAPLQPVITAEPQDTSVIEGQTATFRVEATGTAPLTYQWKKNGLDVGGNSDTYTTPATNIGDDGAKFRVVVTNPAGSATSREALLRVTTTPVAPEITAHPQDTAVFDGQTATFSVTATGTAPLSYQWRKNGSNVGNNSPTYTTQITTPGDYGSKITVIVTNSAGYAVSNEATLRVNPNPSGALIIDHTSTDLSRLPSAWIAAAKSSLKIAYGYTSHGSQIIAGMDAIAAVDSAYSFNNGGTGGALDLRGLASSVASDLGNPNRTAWATATRDYLSAHPEVNVIMWSWCGQVGDANPSDINTYLDLMSGLEKDFPKVKFVYMTGHLDGTGIGGNLNQRNEQIRAYCRANNKVFFDFADIESYDPGGLTNFMELFADDGCNYSGGKNWAQEWLAAHPTDPLRDLVDRCGVCEHSEKLNCVLKARAAWWLWARLAGRIGQ